MDVVTARTLLQVVESGSFKAASERLHVTQSTVSARIKNLEHALGRRLLERSKSGVELTLAGEHFLRHAEAMVRIWRHAQLEVARTTHRSGYLAIGGQISVWDSLLHSWIRKLRETEPRLAISAEVGDSEVLISKLSEGTLDLAVVYRGAQRPGIVFEHIFDEELVMVSSGATKLAELQDQYVFVNWGPEFTADHAQTYPQLMDCGLHLNLGAIGVGMLLQTAAAAYFPLRIVRTHLAEGTLKTVSRARRFVYPVYAAFHEEGSRAALRDDMLELLRGIAAQA